MAFTKKKIQVQFDLANGNFQGGGNKATIDNHRVTAAVRVVGGAEQGSMDLVIYGLPLAMMNQLSTVGTQADRMNRNKIAVFAGDDVTGMSLVFSGLIFLAFVDAQAMPLVAFRVSAVPAGGYWAVKPVPAISKSGSHDVSGMMSDLAKQMELKFENNGVTTKLSNPYYSGSPWTQALRIAKHAGINMIVDRGTMAIMPRNKERKGDAILVSPQTGMVGYPMFDSVAIIVRCLFNPEIKPGGRIEVKSDLTPANGKWLVVMINYDLESETPSGKWFMLIRGVIQK